MSDTPCSHLARALRWLISKGKIGREDLPDTASVIHVLQERLAIVNQVGLDQEEMVRDVVCRLAFRPWP